VPASMLPARVLPPCRVRLRLPAPEAARFAPDSGGAGTSATVIARGSLPCSEGTLHRC
jgi:hypothetical protein